VLPLEAVDGLEMNLVSHEMKKFFGLLLKKNGYVLEQLFSPLVVQTTPEHEELKEICRARLNGCSSRREEAHSSSRGRDGIGSEPRDLGGYGGVMVRNLGQRWKVM
jgi:predicted nucleotidyltransferase